MGDIQFNGTPEEWDALVKKNKEKEEPKPTIKQVDYVAKKQERMYSEEEVIKILDKREDYLGTEPSIFDYLTNKEWFEQFSKLKNG